MDYYTEIKAEKTETDGDDEDLELEVESSEILKALKFGWNAVFSVDNLDESQITDEELNCIIDRTRGISKGDTELDGLAEGKIELDPGITDDNAEAMTNGPTEALDHSDAVCGGLGNAISTSSVPTGRRIQENQEVSCIDFDIDTPLVSTRAFEGQLIALSKEVKESADGTESSTDKGRSKERVDRAMKSLATSLR